MSGGLQIFTDSFHHTHLSALLVDLALKSFILLGVAGLASAFCRRASAATRHWIWFFAILGLAFLPVLSLVLPASPRPMWRVSTDARAGNELTLALEFAPGRNAGTSPNEVQSLAGDSRTNPVSTKESQTARRFAARFEGRWLQLISAAWFSGTLFLSAFLVRSAFRRAAMRRRAQPVTNGEWTALGGELCSGMEIHRPVRLLRSAEDLMPMTWGWFRPVILLPAQAERWTPERRRVVLWHELAHVKRWDCLTQSVARAACTLYWFNPLAWLAARRMCVERERACDDLVLNAGCRASDYANHLVEIARSFRRVLQVAAIAMARPAGLKGRITAIVDSSRARRAPHVLLIALLCLIALCVAAVLAAQKLEAGRDAEAEALRQKQIVQLQEFSTQKQKQSESLLALAGEKAPPDFLGLFDAARKGDFETVTNLYDDFKKRHPQYERRPGHVSDENLAVSCWSPVLEICLAYYEVVEDEPRYTQMAVDDIFGAIPRGSIYFGGTDPGRGLPTAFSKSHADADPFFTLTQNALANSAYLKYLRRMYGAKIYIPTEEESEKCFEEYKADAQMRMQKGQLRPGEDVRIVEGKVQTSGQVAVMAVNARLAKLIFDKNPDYDFHIEESFPLDWMYPYLEPNGLIMKLNRKPLASLTDDVVQRDRRFWTERVDGMIGPWLKEETSAQAIADFVEQVHVRHDLTGFQGDPRFVRSEHAQKLFSKFRSSLAGVFAWRQLNDNDAREKQRMLQAADYAFRQAYALCPTSPEAIYRYVQLLASSHRYDEAIILVKASSKADPKSAGLLNLIRELERMKTQRAGAATASPETLATTDAGTTITVDITNVVALLRLNTSAGHTNEALRLADSIVADPKADAAMISAAAQAYQQLQNFPKLETALRRWVKLTPTPEAFLDYAASQAAQGKHWDALPSIAVALALNRERLRTDTNAPNISTTLGSDPRFVSLKSNPDFLRLLDSNK